MTWCLRCRASPAQGACPRALSIGCDASADVDQIGACGSAALTALFHVKPQCPGPERQLWSRAIFRCTTPQNNRGRSLECGCPAGNSELNAINVGARVTKEFGCALGMGRYLS